MEGVSEFPFRLWVNSISEPISTFTPFLRLTENFPFREIPHYFWPEILIEDFQKIVWWQSKLQVMTPEPRFLKNVIHKIPNGHALDMNCGCPSQTVTGRGSGSSLLRSKDIFSTFLNECFENLGDTPMSVKMRTGFHGSDIFFDLLECLIDLPISHLTVHGRTRDQKYSGNADWSLISQAAQTLKIPVYGSGDLTDQGQILETRIKHPSISGFFIARGAIANPWIFALDKPSTENESFDLARSSLQLFHTLTLLWDEDNPRHFLPILEILNHYKPLNQLQDFEKVRLMLDRFQNGGDDFQKKNRRKALSRTKMIWTYMKNRFPDHPNGRLALRSSSIEEMMSLLGA